MKKNAREGKFNSAESFLYIRKGTCKYIYIYIGAYSAGSMAV
jgi:hypothetical protein